jgi:phosphoenolpyruvate carboxykinase (GTP)
MATSVEKWVKKQAELAQPEEIYWCNGSVEEAHDLIERGLKKEKINGKPVFEEISQKTFPQSYLHRSHPTDVARTEQQTFICHPKKDVIGPNNNWMHPDEAKKKLTALSKGCMRGKTMYVLPYMMGHPDSPYAKACVQLTDVSYVAVSMRIMTRMSKGVLDKIGSSENFVKGFHSTLDFDVNKRNIAHFPEDNLVWSVGSGYGGNALLGKKCFSLRIASWLGLQEGWLAEHMLIVGVESPEGDISYIAAALPSACGKTNLAMLQSALPGYKIWTLGDDIAWLNVGPDGRMYAINPEMGFFGVAPGTSMKTNPNMVLTLKKGTFYPTLFTNTGLDTDNNEPWWEGFDGSMPKNLLDWQGEKFDPASGKKAAHPNSRFTVSATHCPTLSKEFDNPQGVPISAIIFGSRRTTLIPLVYESFSWRNGVFSGSRMGSETTAAAAHKEGVVRRDPMAMLPFCGYNMADYFKHWLSLEKKMSLPPKIFFVNWFRQDDSGKFIWPGFGDNIRVLKWVIERTKGSVSGKETPIGIVPHIKDLALDGLSIPKPSLEKLFAVDKKEWQAELDDIRNFYGQFGSSMPAELFEEYEMLKKKMT